MVVRIHRHESEVKFGGCKLIRLFLVVVEEVALLPNLDRKDSFLQHHVLFHLHMVAHHLLQRERLHILWVLLLLVEADGRVLELLDIVAERHEEHGVVVGFGLEAHAAFVAWSVPLSRRRTPITFPNLSPLRIPNLHQPMVV